METSLAWGDLNAVGCGASWVGSSGVSPAACLANNFPHNWGPGCLCFSHGNWYGSRTAWAHLGTGVATNTCRTLARGMDFLILAKKPPMSGAWGAIELDTVWLGWATVARGSAPSRWASSCSSMLDLCSTAIGAAPGVTSGTSGSSKSGAFPRVAEGVPLVLFFFRISPAESVSAFLFFFFFFPPSPFTPGLVQKLQTQGHRPGPSCI